MSVQIAVPASVCLQLSFPSVSDKRLLGMSHVMGAVTLCPYTVTTQTLEPWLLMGKG